MRYLIILLLLWSCGDNKVHRIYKKSERSNLSATYDGLSEILCNCTTDFSKEFDQDHFRLLEDSCRTALFKDLTIDLAEYGIDTNNQKEVVEIFSKEIVIKRLNKDCPQYLKVMLTEFALFQQKAGIVPKVLGTLKRQYLIDNGKYLIKFKLKDSDAVVDFVSETPIDTVEWGKHYGIDNISIDYQVKKRGDKYINKVKDISFLDL